MALTLFKPELDQWEPGEHNGTFRGHNPAFVTATAALEFWTDDQLEKDVVRKGEQIEQALHGIVDSVEGAQVRGRGLVQGVAFEHPLVAAAVCREAFDRGLLMETSGAESEVVKLMPSLLVDDAELDHGLMVVSDSIEAVTTRELVGAAAGIGDGSDR
jgi:diaminobutyrate-2-oxoglutarate transaminase